MKPKKKTKKRIAVSCEGNGEESECGRPQIALVTVCFLRINGIFQGTMAENRAEVYPEAPESRDSKKSDKGG